MPQPFTRRLLLLGAIGVTTSTLIACATGRRAADQPPIVFVHGNGDSAALWMTTIWRFESNGWPSDRLFAFDLPYPLARDADASPQPGRTSIDEYTQRLAVEVDRVLQATGARQVVLFGNSRGGYAIRNYIAHGGAPKVSHAILGGVPNHGVWANPAFQPGSEFNGAGPFLSKLNTAQGVSGDEVTPGVKWLTLRSDHNDKYAQPDGVWIGAKGAPTHVGFDGPALRGAENIVLPGVDHRETAFSAPAFAAAYRFITGRDPATTAVLPQAPVRLDGLVSGLGIDNRPGGGGFANNLPLVGAQVEVYATDPASGERRGPAAYRKTIGADGHWGPFTADGSTSYEFVVSAPGFATTHIYRSPFPRSSKVVGLRAERLADIDKDAAAVVTFSRPRGYFGLPRDQISFDGISPPAGIPSGTPGVSSVKLKLIEGAGRSVVGVFNGERIAGRAWPAATNNVTLLELTY